MNRLRQFWLDVRSSFWFLPATIVIFAIILAIGLIILDDWIDRFVYPRWHLLFMSAADGSRALLATIAGSMITVAGVVFSITLVALSLASSQYSPRVLRNFRRDRINQGVLGVFVGIFIYCLVVLRSIQSGENGVAFVPAIAVAVGFLFGLVGIFYLIFFIHHLAKAIQASHIIASITADTFKAIDHLFPDLQEENDVEQPSSENQPKRIVFAKTIGYIEEIDVQKLHEYAKESHVVIQLERSIGEFVFENAPMLSVIGSKVLEQEDLAYLRSTYVIGRERTIEQDAAFGIRQLVDIALKALSPGINDVTTANICIHHLTAILARLINRRIDIRFKIKDKTTLISDPRGPNFLRLFQLAFDQIRQHASGNMTIIENLLESLDVLSKQTAIQIRKKYLLEYAKEIRNLALNSTPSKIDHQYIQSFSSNILDSMAEK